MAIVLLACALVLVVGAEWPRLSAKVGTEGRATRKRARRKESFTVIDGDGGDDSDDFAKSVERDLANLPVLEERGDDRTQQK